MQDQLSYIQGKVDRIDDRMDNVDKTLAVNTNLLGEHIKRTNLLEKQMGNVNEHVIRVRFLGKIAVWCAGALVTILAGVVAFIFG